MNEPLPKSHCWIPQLLPTLTKHGHPRGLLALLAVPTTLSQGFTQPRAPLAGPTVTGSSGSRASRTDSLIPVHIRKLHSLSHLATTPSLRTGPVKQKVCLWLEQRLSSASYTSVALGRSLCLTEPQSSRLPNGNHISANP